MTLSPSMTGKACSFEKGKIYIHFNITLTVLKQVFLIYKTKKTNYSVALNLCDQPTAALHVLYP